MKKLLLPLNIVMLLTLLTACEKDLPVYNGSDSMLNFVYAHEQNSDSTCMYSFVYESDDVVKDTVWFDITTMGFPQDRDRYYELEQVLTGNHDAVPGKHYVAFDDADYRSKLCVPAGAIEARLPVVVLRDPSLKTEGNVTLRLKFEPNDEFIVGYITRSFKVLTISDILSRPNNWNGICDHYFGDYGPVKHQFMIDVSGERWDDDYLVNTLRINESDCDQNYILALSNKFYKALQEENARRAANNLDPLAEDDGTLVAFDMGA